MRGQPSPAPSRSRSPTVKPSTRTPTAAPTLSLGQKWKILLDGTFQELGADDSSSIVDRVTYYGTQGAFLSSTTIIASSLQGGCNSWRYNLENALTIASSSYVVDSITWIHYTSPEDTMESSTIVCNKKAESTQIMKSLISLSNVGSTGSSNNKNTSVVCNGHTWKMQKCESYKGINNVGMCVDCNDVCSISGKFIIAPCANTSTLASLSSYDIVSFGLADMQKAPSVNSIQITPSTSSLKISMKVSYDGILYVGLYEATNNNSVSVESILLQNRMIISNHNVSDLELVGLSASTSYNAYVLTRSFQGAQMSLSDMLLTKTTAFTKCCREVAVQLTSASIVEGKDMINFITMVVSVMPEKELTLALELYQSTNSSEWIKLSPDMFVPNTFVVSKSGSAKSMVFRASLSKMTLGSYGVRLRLSGHDVSKYAVVYSGLSATIDTSSNQGLLLQVQGVDTPLPAPSLSKAIFANDGSSITVTFDAETNRGGTLSSFVCSNILDFACASSSKCQWQDASTIIAFVNSNAQCVKPGDTLGLSTTAMIRARCTASNGVCASQSTWPISDVKSGLMVLSPITAVLPSVVITLPSTIGSCTSLTMDLSSSTGNGGRSWSNSSIIVQGSQQDSDTSSDSTKKLKQLQVFLVHNYTMSPPTAIPYDLLTEGQSYTFLVTLCNFLGKCSQASKRVSVLSTIIPVVSIPGSTLRTMKRSDVLSISASAQLSTCEPQDSNSMLRNTIVPLSYAWSVYVGNAMDINLISTSKDPSRMVLSAYSLSVNTMYKMVVSVAKISSSSSSSSSLSSSAQAMIQVYVESGSIVTVLKDGTGSRSMRVGGELILDASLSYDEDVKDKTGRGAGLEYSWTCMQLQPVLKPQCEGVFSQAIFSVYVNAETMRLKALNNTISSNAVGEISLTIQDSSKSRSVTQKVTVTILPLLTPVINVVSLSRLGSRKTSNSSTAGGSYYGIINAGQTLQLSGTISLPAMLQGNASWSLDSNSRDVELSKISLSPLIQRIAKKDNMKDESILQSMTMYLAIAANSLTAGASYTFVLDCVVPFPGSSSQSSITITVNAAPSPGIFVVSPREGKELIDRFTFASSQWYDIDLPLSYQYSYVSITGSTIVLKSRSEASYASLLLPAGLQSQSYRTSCVGEIYDNMMASTVVKDEVKVRVMQLTDVQAGEGSTNVTSTSNENSKNMALLQAVVGDSLKSLSSSTNADDIKQTSMIASYLLNKVNCSLAPNCSSLHRKACYRTAHTCGPCISSSYIGTEGDSNEECYDISSFNAAKDSSNIAKVLKQCNNDCSGHGSCHYYDASSDEEMDSCYVGSLQCYAKCQCEVGYQGSSNCALSDDEVEARQQLRDQVVEGILTLTKLEDASEVTIVSWITSLSEMSQNVDEISTNSATTIMSIVSNAISLTESLSLSSNGLDGVLSLLDASFTASHNSDRVFGRRRRLEEDMMKSTAELHDTLKNYTKVVGGEMVPGQQAIESVQSMFRMQVGSFEGSEIKDANGNCISEHTMQMPSSSKEKLLGSVTPSMTFPSCNVNALESTEGRKVAMVSVNANSFVTSNPLMADPVSLHMSHFPCSQEDSEHCEISMVLPVARSRGKALDDHIGSIQESLQKAPATITTCLEGDLQIHEYQCPMDYNYTIACNGTAASIESRCPSIHASLSCNMMLGYTGATDDGSSCRLVAHNDYNMTCVCNLMKSLVASSGGKRNRYLLSSSSTDSNQTMVPIPEGEYSVSYASMLFAVADTFTKTVLSAQDLNASSVKKGWQVLVTISVLIASILVSMALSHVADAKVKRKVSLEAEKKDTRAPPMTRMQSWIEVKKKNKVSALPTRNKTNHNKAKNGVMQLADEALPNVLLASKSLTTRVIDELKRHHRWLGVVYYFSKRFPRLFRVVSLATNIITMLFIQSITYNLTNGDDGSCERLGTETDCLAPRSAYATGSSKCYWTYDSSASSADGSCHFVQPDQDLTVIVFVAIFSAVVSTPIALSADWIILNILSAPTIKFSVKKSQLEFLQNIATNGMPMESKSLGFLNKNQAGKIAADKADSKLDGIIPVGDVTQRKRRDAKWSLLFLRSQPGKEKNYAQIANVEYKELCKELVAYRNGLENATERSEFDGKYFWIC